MPLEFQKSADEKHQEKLDSSIVSANWVENCVVAGGVAQVEVRTAFVGNGAPIKLTAKTEGGDDGGSVKGKVRRNVFRGELPVKDSLPEGCLLYFEVDCPDSQATGKSHSVPVLLPPKISELSWGVNQAKRGDILKLSAKVKDVPVETPCTVEIFEFDEDGAHDPIASLPGQVIDKKVEVFWEYQYHDDTDEIPSQGDLDPYDNAYQAPEYFFVVDIYGFRVGEAQESGRLRFQDYIEIRLPPDLATQEEPPAVKVQLPDGSERDVEFDDDGFAVLEDVPPGPCDITVEVKEDSDTQS